MPTALVTGAAKRVGAAISKALAFAGWEVILHYHNSRKEVSRLSESLKKQYRDRNFPFVQCDLSNPDAVLSFFSQLPDGLVVDALINNASIFDPGTIEETSLGFLRKEMLVNFEAPFFLMQTFKNSFGKGAVVNMLDTKILKNEGTHAAYLLAKKNLAEATKMAALSFAPEIRINAVAPGPVLPPPGKNEDYFDKIVKETPLKIKTNLDDITQSVLFLLNNTSVTGQIVFCDSGLHLT